MESEKETGKSKENQRKENQNKLCTVFQSRKKKDSFFPSDSFPRSAPHFVPLKFTSPVIPGALRFTHLIIASAFHPAVELLAKNSAISRFHVARNAIDLNFRFFSSFLSSVSLDRSTFISPFFWPHSLNRVAVAM